MYASRNEELEKIMKTMNKLQEIISLLKVDIDPINENKTFNLINDIEKIVNKNIQSTKELEEPFLLFIMGCGNYGKSTLINALLKKNIVNTNDIPNTWKLDLFIKSKKESIEITYQDEARRKMNLKQGNQFLQIEEAKIKKSKTIISQSIHHYKKNNKVSIDTLKKYKNELEQNNLYTPNIEQIKYYIKDGYLLNNFIIVDTPGLNQTLLKNTMSRIKEYYRKADGVIWVIDAQNIVSNENSKLIDEIKKIDEIDNKSKKIIGVVNKMDIISKYNEANIAKVRRKSNEIFKNKFCDIVYISAKQAIDGELNNDDTLIENSNIKTLYNSIQINFTDICEHNQIESKYKNLYIMKNDIINIIHIYKRELYNEISIYTQIEFELKERISAIKSYNISHMDSFINKRINKYEDAYILRQNIEKLQEQCSLDLKKAYDTLYDKIKLENINQTDIINTNVCFSRSKNLISNQYTKDKISYKSTNQVENILNKLTSKIYPNTNPNEVNIENNTYININKLKEEVMIIIDEKAKLIESTINKLRYKRFKHHYLEYVHIKKHIDYLNEIEKILSDLG